MRFSNKKTNMTVKTGRDVNTRFLKWLIGSGKDARCHQHGELALHPRRHSGLARARMLRCPRLLGGMYSGVAVRGKSLGVSGKW